MSKTALAYMGEDTHESPIKYPSFPGYLKSAFVAHLKKTHRPEHFPGLCFDVVDKTLPFKIIHKFQIDRKQRAGVGLVHCAMCGVEKFLEGSLVWIEPTQRIALIGHCCADKDNIEAASNEYRRRTTTVDQEDFLLRAIPLVGRIRDAASGALLVAEACSSARRKFRSQFPELTEQLLYAARGAGLLTYSEEVNEELEGIGPKGFRSRGRSRSTRIRSVGTLSGGQCLKAGFNPTKHFRFVKSKLSIFPEGHPSEEEALKFTADLEPEYLAEAVSYFRAARADYLKGLEEVRNAADFFSLENQQRVAIWQEKSRSFAAYEVRPQSGAVSLTWRVANAYGHLLVPTDVFRQVPNWPIVDFGD